MKKFVKVMLILAAVLTAAGIGLSVAGAAMGGAAESAMVMQQMRERFGDTFDYFYIKDLDDDWDDYDDYDGRDYSAKETLPVEAAGDSRTYQFGEMKNLDIELRYDELILEEHNGAGILVEVLNDPKEMVRVKESGDTLEITSSRKLEKKRVVKIFYPKNAKFREVELGVGAGNVEVRSNLYTDELKVNMGAGEFTNSGTLTAPKTELEVGAGNMTVAGLHAKELEGQCGVGDLSLEISGKETDYNYSLECGIGNITIGDEDFSGFGKEKNIHNPGAAGEIDLECGIGNISVAFVQE